MKIRSFDGIEVNKSAEDGIEVNKVQKNKIL